MFYRFPKSMRRFNQYMGEYMMPCLVFAGVVSTVMWLLINHTTWYMPEYHSVELIYAVLVGGCSMIIYLIARRTYRRYQSIAA